MSSEFVYEKLNGRSIGRDDLALRLDALEKIIVRHKRFDELYDAIKDCHELQRNSPTKKGVCILGDTGAGKSTLFKYYESQYPRSIKLKSYKGLDEETQIVPVLRVELDSNSNPGNVASKMLDALGDKLHYKGTEKQLTARLRNWLESSEVELVFIDEVQHLVDTDTERVIRKAADWLKQLLNDVNIPIVFGGIRDKAIRIFETNQQLDERFPYKPPFYGFKFDAPEEIIEFRGYLKNLEKRLPLSDKSHLYDPMLSEKIYYASLGIPRNIGNLLRHSMTLVLNDGQDKLSEKYLHDGFNMLTFATRPNVENPFNEKTFDWKVAIEKEKLKKK